MVLAARHTFKPVQLCSAHNPWSAAGRTCLEIGCGAGMVGVALHRAGTAHVLCTDGDAQTVANCQVNLQLNGVPLANGSSGWKCSSSSSSIAATEWQLPQAAAECRQLCWEDGWPGANEAGGEQRQAPTVVLGADLLYDPTVIPTLLSLLKQVLTAAARITAGPCSQQAQQQQPAAYLATTLRNEATLLQFLAAVEADPAISMQQLAGPPMPGPSSSSSSSSLPMPSRESNARDPAGGAADADAAVAAGSAAGEPGRGCSIRWQHLPELDAARERIFLHRITLA